MPAGAGEREGKLSLSLALRTASTAQERGVQRAVLPWLACENRTGRQRCEAPPWLTSSPACLKALLATWPVWMAGSLASLPPQAGVRGVPQIAAVGAQNKAKKPQTCPSVTPKCKAPRSPGSGPYTHRAKPESLHWRAEIPIFFLLLGSFPRD